MKKPRLSFVPTYHELVQALEGPSWRPMYNPVRACVQEERAKIEAEGGRVLNRLWTPVKTTHKRHSWGSTAVLALFTSNLLGLAVLAGFFPGWLEAQPLWVSVPAVLVTGGLTTVAGFFLMVFSFDIIFEHNRKHPTDSAE